MELFLMETLRGHDGSALIGHISVIRLGVHLRCGSQDCLEVYASATAMSGSRANALRTIPNRP